MQLTRKSPKSAPATKRDYTVDDRQQASFMKPDEAHKIIGKDAISRRSFYNGLNRGEIPSVRVGRRILIPVHAFNLWLEGRWTAEGSTAA